MKKRYGGWAGDRLDKSWLIDSVETTGRSGGGTNEGG